MLGLIVKQFEISDKLSRNRFYLQSKKTCKRHVLDTTEHILFSKLLQLLISRKFPTHSLYMASKILILNAVQEAKMHDLQSR